MTSTAAAAAPETVDVPALQVRQQEIVKRLSRITVPPFKVQPKKKVSSAAAATSNVVVFQEKTDTHWDFLLKEMQWLAADFTAERKRHVAASKKVAASVAAYNAGAAQRDARAVQDAILKRRKLAARISRDHVMKKWWGKLDRVITYQQKVSYDQSRAAAMNQQLVQLVQQTEKYTASLGGALDSSKNNTDSSAVSAMTIEQALAMPETRRSKHRVSDYARLLLETNASGGETATSLYGETSEDSGSDATYSENDDSAAGDDQDDESTLRAAEEEERLERRRHNRQHDNDDDNASDDDSKSFEADPVELRKLQEEGDMEIDQVLARLREEGGDFVPSYNDDSGPIETRVQFAESVGVDSSGQVVVATDEPMLQSRQKQQQKQQQSEDPGSDADDDMDASDVEDYSDGNANGGEELDEDDDEFIVDKIDEPDDETTLEQEELLPQEMTAAQELELLRQENEVSVEELRQRYAQALGTQPDDEAIDSSALRNDTIAEENQTSGSRPRSAQKELLLAASEGDGGQVGEEDCVAANDEEDDETTVEAEEKNIRDKDKLDLFEKEGEMPIDQLRAVGNAADMDRIDSAVESEGDDSADDKDPQPAAEHLLVDGIMDDDGDIDEEYQPEEAAVDDETTMEAEEKLGRDMSYEEEIAVLQRESELSVDELRAMYARMDEEAVDEESDAFDENETAFKVSESAEPANSVLPQLLESIEDQENDEDFQPDEDLLDDETTLEAEERLGRELSAEEELAMLQKESERPIEELRSMYEKMAQESPSGCEASTPMANKRKRVDKETKDDDTKKQRQDTGIDAIDKLEASTELARTTIASRPFLIPPWVKLREYQQIGLNWLVSLQARRLNGILADEMGLGKTLQTISLLAYLAAYKGIWGPHLIVVPTSVILNWETELKRFCPALKVLCYYGSAKRRKELRTGWTKSNWYHVVVTSYQLVVQDSFAFKRKRWYYLVLDEAQHIKNFQSQRWQTLISFNTQRRLLLTGTPLQNNLMELWSLLHFLMPYIFRSRKEFSFWFANPMNSMIEGTSNQNDDVVHRLHGIIRPFVLRRLKKDVETQMPGKFEHIVKCQLSRRQMFIYEEFMARSSTRQALKKGGNFMGMMNVLMQLRKVCNHPDLFEPRSVLTPLVVHPIIVPMASCVIGMIAKISVFAKVSDSLLCPLWSGSQGAPSLEAGLRHDVIESDELLSLESSIVMPSKQSVNAECKNGVAVCAALRALAQEVYDREHRERLDNAKNLNTLNSWRCQAAPFAYPRRLIEAISLPEPPLQRKTIDVLSTPTQLIAMRKDQLQRADDVSGLIKRFVFAVPKAGAQPVAMSTNLRRTDIISASVLNEVLLEPVQESLRPFREAHARLTSFFPDKKLVQFDAGKLQALAELLRERKRGGHKVLIFTQMSKMLDILEAFLNLNGHTYVRLDGGTGIDQRQRLMDRFNNDQKIFCFILSTRSGGTGVNLIGADTVVFYDSDWNPAQDAQAQDRAHRIGQTREVHIFRLITEHTIEENILVKAKQKRNLDILVMDRGNFDASQLQTDRAKPAEASVESDHVNDIYTKGGLRAILGATAYDDDGAKADDYDNDVSNDQIEKAMTSLEDVDDVNALRGARKEATDELQEFDETIEYKKDSDAEEDEEANEEKVIEDSSNNGNGQDDPKSDEKELEKEFAAWQDKVGMDTSAIKASLSPVERYGLRFHEEVDPYYSIFAVLEYRRKMEVVAEKDDEIDIDAMERANALEESRAFDEGDLLSTNPRPEDLIRQRNLYRREKARLFGSKKRRKLTGENWECRADAGTQQLFWYNIDTGEALWDKPKVLLEIEAYDLASQNMWAAMPMKPLVNIMSFLLPFPDRMRSSEVCRQWLKAATDTSFVRHVYPVEMGAYTRDETKIEYNHYRTLDGALQAALPGDTIELSDGHYWQNADMVVKVPLRLMGDEDNPSNVIVEMSGTIVWQAKGGFFEGVTFRRPKISSSERSSLELLRVGCEGKLDMARSVFDNEGSSGNVVTLVGPGNKGRWESVSIQQGAFGISLQLGARLEFLKGAIVKNNRSGVVCEQGSDLKLVGCKIDKNVEHGIDLKSQSRLTVRRSRVTFNGGLVLSKDSGCTTSCSGNVCTRSSSSALPPPGFQFLTD